MVNSKLIFCNDDGWTIGVWFDEDAEDDESDSDED